MGYLHIICFYILVIYNFGISPLLNFLIDGMVELWNIEIMGSKTYNLGNKAKSILAIFLKWIISADTHYSIIPLEIA